jgi:hypothetical protein
MPEYLKVNLVPFIFILIFIVVLVWLGVTGH